MRPRLHAAEGSISLKAMLKDWARWHLARACMTDIPTRAELIQCLKAQQADQPGQIRQKVLHG